MKEISVVLPILDEETNLTTLLPALHKTLQACVDSFEILVIDGGSRDHSADIAKQYGARVVTQSEGGFANAICEGIKTSQGKYILTMDADNSHSPACIKNLIDARNEAELVIGSRFIKGALFQTSAWRKILSLLLNKVFNYLLALPINDISSGFRIYKNEMFKYITVESRGFDIQLETLIKIIAGGWRVKEIPIHYTKRLHGKSKVRVFRCGMAFLRTFFKMYRLRNSIQSGDYDDRAYRSRLCFQRMWHTMKDRVTFKYVCSDKRTLDAGCGSGGFIQKYKAVGLDIDIKKLRYLYLVKRLAPLLAMGSVENLPFKDGSFEQLVCSETIEHIPKSKMLFQEFNRVLQLSGRLIITTPDYGRLSLWPLLEWVYAKIIPDAYADRHISHYTIEELKGVLDTSGFKVIASRTFFKAIIIIQAEKIFNRS